MLDVKGGHLGEVPAGGAGGKPDHSSQGREASHKQAVGCTQSFIQASQQ